MPSRPLFTVLCLALAGAAIGACSSSRVEPNSPPSFRPLGPLDVPAGTLFTLAVRATDPDPGDQVTYALRGRRPPGAVINPRSGLFGWNPGYDLVGRELRFLFVATDLQGAEATLPGRLTVRQPGFDLDPTGGERGEGNRPPVIDPIADRTVSVGDDVRVLVSARDPDPGDRLRVSLGGRIPDGAAYHVRVGELRWQPGPRQEGQTYLISFEVSDGEHVVAQEVTLRVRKSQPGAEERPEAPPCADDASDSGEGDDDAASAADLRRWLGQPLQICPGDPDFFAVDLHRGSAVELELRFERGEAELEIQVRGPRGLLLSGDPTANGAWLRLDPVRRGGLHLVAVFGAREDSAGYQLLLEEAHRLEDCAGDELPCADDAQCVHESWVCDGEADCPNGSDETGCPFECLPIEFACESDGHCIPRAWACDGGEDCEDGSDELACRFICDEGRYTCADGGQCVEEGDICDDFPDCFDGSDEVGCDEEFCDPAYPDFCLPPPPPDINCTDLDVTRFRVLLPDPHGLDRDGDGTGCE